MSLNLSIFIIVLCSLLIVIQIFFILKLLNKVNKEKVALINIHKEHLKVITEQRDLYRELLDTFIEKHVIYNNVGHQIANWCPCCNDTSLIDNGKIVCSICGWQLKQPCGKIDE